MNALISYFKNVRMELSHVVWLSPKTAVSHALLVVLISVVIAALAGALDYLFTGIMTRFFL